jgi:hypothetical protein
LLEPLSIPRLAAIVGSAFSCTTSEVVQHALGDRAKNVYNTLFSASTTPLLGDECRDHLKVLSRQCEESICVRDAGIDISGNIPFMDVSDCDVCFAVDNGQNCVTLVEEVNKAVADRKLGSSYTELYSQEKENEKMEKEKKEQEQQQKDNTAADNTNADPS